MYSNHIQCMGPDLNKLKHRFALKENQENLNIGRVFN